jgi:hypothetical protein
MFMMRCTPGVACRCQKGISCIAKCFANFPNSGIDFLALLGPAIGNVFSNIISEIGTPMP